MRDEIFTHTEWKVDKSAIEKKIIIREKTNVIVLKDKTFAANSIKSWTEQNYSLQSVDA